MTQIYGQRLDSARRLTYLDLGGFTANSTVTPTARFGCPVGVAGGLRVIGIHVSGDAVPSDADGTMVVNALVNDVSEAADDTIVSSEDMETLITAANQFFEATLATETSEKELTLEPGDTLRFTLVSDSAAIDTDSNLVVCVEWHEIPDWTSDEQLVTVEHPDVYTE